MFQVSVRDNKRPVAEVSFMLSLTALVMLGVKGAVSSELWRCLHLERCICQSVCT